MASEAIEKGDIVWIDYDAWTVNPNGTQTLFDTTHDEVAKKEGKFDEKKVYLEIPVVVGRGRLFEGLEAALVGMNIGDTKEVAEVAGVTEVTIRNRYKRISVAIGMVK